MKNSLLKGLSEEQIAKVKACKNSDEILALAQKEGVELTDEQLEAVNGGFCDPDGSSINPIQCPKCHRTNTKLTGQHDVGKLVWDTYYCYDCDFEYRVVKGGY